MPWSPAACCLRCRGAALEMLLSKLVACRGRCSVQVVAMSATMSGLDSLSAWLGGHLFLTNFRPVPLSEHAVFGGTVYAKAGQTSGEQRTGCSRSSRQAQQQHNASDKCCP